MLTLMTKDFRLLRPVLLAAAGLAMLFWVLLPVVSAATWDGVPPRADFVYDWKRLAASLLDGSNFLWIALPLLCGVVGGMGFATERGERWADWQAVLPVPRGRTVAAKLVASVTVCWVLTLLLAIGTSLTVYAAMWAADAGRGRIVSESFLQTIAGCLAAAVGLFGVAWLLSTLLASGVYASAIAIGFGGGAFLWCAQLVNDRPRLDWPDALLRLHLTAVAVGVVCVVAGAVVQSLRRTP